MGNRHYRIGIVGTGFIGRGLTRVLVKQPRLMVEKVLTRRHLQDCLDFPAPELLTNSANELLDHVDLIVECSGDIRHAAEVVDRAFEAGIPVVTMNAEFHVTAGSYFVERGVLSEAEGDQPGVLAALHENTVAMGFQPLVLANVKGFYDPNPTPEDMKYWSRKQGISMAIVTAATDGTKIQFEQALVANGLGAGIVRTGLVGIAAKDLESGARSLAMEAEKTGCVISDYIILPNANTRVFIVARHEITERDPLAYLKMGEGPYYVIPQSLNLTYLEIPKTILRILSRRPPLLNNSQKPSISVAAVAKRPLAPGTEIRVGIGSFDVRGVAVRIVDVPDHLPIGLLQDAVVRQAIEPGQWLDSGDVDIPDSLASQAWVHTRSAALSQVREGSDR